MQWNQFQVDINMVSYDECYICTQYLDFIMSVLFKCKLCLLKKDTYSMNVLLGIHIMYVKMLLF